MDINMQIDKLKPGRELDAFVAEMVMGWTFQDDGSWFNGKDYVFLSWSPSTDIAAAWEVVEKMKQVHFMFYLEACPQSSEPTDLKDWGWTACFQKFDPISSFSFDVPHAICLAALKAISANQEHQQGSERE